MSEIKLHCLEQNVCTCGAHPGESCNCDSSYCTGGAALLDDDGNPYYRLDTSDEELVSNRKYLEQRAK